MPTTRLDPRPAFHDIDKWVNEALTRPDSFAMRDDDPKWFTTWSLGPVFKHRDSDNIQEANARALMKHLESDPTLAPYWDIIGCSHWAVGHVDHLAFKVIGKVGRGPSKSTDLLYLVPSRPGYMVTRMARVVKDWFDGLEEYPVADDEELSKIEYEASLETLQQQSPPRGRDFIDVLPENWVDLVYNRMYQTGGISVEGQGAWADEDKLEETLDSLGLLKPEED